MRQSDPKSSPRRTLPAPSEPVDVGAVLAERDRLRFEVTSLHAEVSRLRGELARLRDERAADGSFGPDPSERQPLPSPLPRMFAREASSDVYAKPLHSAGVPTGGPAYAPPPSQGASPGTFSSSTGIDFGTVSRLSPGELDALPYGLICLDAQGRVVHYNDTESRLARLPKDRVVGRNFFTEVAPCTRVREFEGNFHDLVRDPSSVRVRSFDFVFKFRHSEQHVTIVMTPARTRGLYNLALLRRSIVQST